MKKDGLFFIAVLWLLIESRRGGVVSLYAPRASFVGFLRIPTMLFWCDSDFRCFSKFRDSSNRAYVLTPDCRKDSMRALSFSAFRRSSSLGTKLFTLRSFTE